VDGTQASGSNLGAQGLTRSGTRGGSVVGISTLSPRLSLDLFSPSLATAGGTSSIASLDFWITFSTTPIFGLPSPGGGGSVPEPPTFALALVALGLLWRRRARTR
jgi:MYXO-CTERM domain-containing protein